MATDTFKRGDRIEYVGCYVNALGKGEFLTYEQAGGVRFAIIRTNDAVHRVVVNAVIACEELAL